MPPPVKVYVNLADHIAHGHTITVTTTKSANKTGTRQSSWSIKGDRANLGDNRGLPATPFVDGTTVTETLPLQPAQRTFVNHARLGHIGGNRFTVEVKKVNAGLGSRALTTPELETWRKIFITVNAMAGLDAEQGAVLGDLPGLLAPAFIELEARAPATPAHGVLPTRTRIDSDDLPGLIQAMPATLYAGTAPGQGSVEDGLWARVVLVNRLSGSRTSQTKQLLQTDGVSNNGSWTFTVQAGDKQLFFAPSAVTKLTLRLLARIALHQALDFAASSVKREGSTRWTLTVSTDEVPQQAIARAKTPLKDHVALLLTSVNDVEYRIPLSDATDGTLTFKAETSQANAIGHASWQKPETFKRAVVELQTDGFAVDFRPDGTEASGLARVTLAQDEASYTLDVLDVGLNLLLTNAFAGTHGDVDLSVTHRYGINHAGHSSGRTIAIAVRDIEARANETNSDVPHTIMLVVAHEIIHSLGGVAQDLLGGDHPTYYPEALGGVATGEVAHCSSGTVRTSAAALQQDTDPLRRRIYEPGKNPIYAPPDANAQICVMYHRMQLPNFAAAQLCANCLKQLRTLDLKKTSVKLNA